MSIKSYYRDVMMIHLNIFFNYWQKLFKSIICRRLPFIAISANYSFLQSLTFGIGAWCSAHSLHWWPCAVFTTVTSYGGVLSHVVLFAQLGIQGTSW